MKKGIALLGILFVGIVAVIVLRLVSSPNVYTTPDSIFYLAAADNLLAGKGLLAPHPDRDHVGREIFFAVWPVGYPLCIAGFSALTGASVLWASKIFNLFCLASIFVLLYRWFGERAWFPALYFCSYSLLEIYSHTWSECPFLFFAFLLLFLIDKRWKEEQRDTFLFLKLAACLIALFLFRYAGLIYFVGLAGLVVYSFYYRNKKNMAFHGFWALVLASIFVLAYFYMNKIMSGHYTGVDRIRPDQESWGLFLRLFIQGFFNELTLARNYYFNGVPDYLYLLLFIIQCAVVYWLYVQRKLLSSSFWKKFSPALLGGGLVYLLLIVVLRKLNPFDPFDYRILAPFSMPLYIAILVRMTLPDAADYFQRVRWVVVGFMILSLLVNLPKNFLWILLNNWWT